MSIVNPRRGLHVGSRPSRRALALAAVLLGLLSVGSGAAAAGAPPVGTATPTAWKPAPGAAARVVAVAPAAAGTVIPTHPYSDPTWLPLRNPARISCVRTNCLTSTGEHYHGYWAIDFLGHRGDPVHAAGAGIFHVGANDRTCGKTTASAGVWGWVDHGGGRVSKYNHLDTIVATEGQYVTPDTVIATVGHWGDVAPCTTDYLHFEVREGGITGTRVDPGSLSVCTSSGRVSLPGAFNGATSFDALPKVAFTTPASTSRCITDSWHSTPPRPTLTAVSGPSSAALTWSAPPAGTTSVRVSTQLWSTTHRAWVKPVYTTVSGTSKGTTVTGLLNGRSYRITVTHQNSAGYSAWSAARTVVPATVPSVPEAPRFLTAPTRDYAHYGWYKSADNGSPTTQYVSQVRCSRGGEFTAWKTAYTVPTVYYHNHRGLTGYTTCQLRVRAENAVGPSGWSVVSTLHKPA